MRKTPAVAAFGALFLAAAVTPAVSAETNPFASSPLQSGYDLANYDKHVEGKCGQGKAAKEGKCGEGKAAKEGKCGEGKAAKEGKCGEGKAVKEGKCGTGKAAK
jgi:uncharacterized low-complexity protein